MLFLTFGNILLFSIQWLCETIRYQRYARTMQRLLRTTCVLVQRARTAHSGFLTRTSLLSVDVGTAEKLELEDDYIRISSVDSMQEVDLSTWTSYTSYLDTHNVVAEPHQNICVLLEARRPTNLNKFVRSTMKVHPAYQVHVLSHGCPIAWKTAEPFGIILHCTFAGLVILTDAFGQGRLTLDEDLELIGLVTVKTKGKPQTLVPQAGDFTSAEGAEENSQTDTFAKSRGQGITGQHESSRGGGDSHSAPSDTSKQGKQFSTFHDTQEKEGHKPPKSGKESEIHDSSNRSNAPASSQQKTHSEASTRSSFSGHIKQDKEAFSTDGKSSNQKPYTKPPNILVYCGIKDTARKFAEVKSSLEACINTDAYTIYHLNHDSVLSVPWKKNTALLVISSCVQLRREVDDEIADYVFKEGGYVLSFNSSLESSFTERVEEKGADVDSLFTFPFKDAQAITSVRGQYCYINMKGNVEVVIPSGPQEAQISGEKSQNGEGHAENDKGFSSSASQSKALVIKVHCEGGGVAVLSQLLLERDPTEYAKDQESFAALKRSNTERLAVLRDLLASLGLDTSTGPVPSLTPCLLLARKEGLKDSFLQSFKHRLRDNNILKSEKMSLRFVESQTKCEPTAAILPVVTDAAFNAKSDYFEPGVYWENLRTSSLGQVVFYTDIITSTMPVFDGLLFSIPPSVGPIAIAGRQTSGKGRAGNAWLSPVGCAMFTLPLRVDVDSLLGQRISFLQHIVSLAVVHSIVTLPGYEDLKIRLKWPNDIYFGKEMKLGGVLVTSTVMGPTVYATIGCGFNVSNSNPTICINDIIHLYNTSHPHLPDLPPLSPSQLIARTVTEFEHLVQAFQKNGHHDFCQQYYQYWLHSGVKVKVQLDKTTEGEIVGVDEYGFLSIRTPKGEHLSVQPDGNSFDMMHNLIHIKSGS